MSKHKIRPKTRRQRARQLADQGPHTLRVYADIVATYPRLAEAFGPLTRGQRAYWSSALGQRILERLGIVPEGVDGTQVIDAQIKAEQIRRLRQVQDRIWCEPGYSADPESALDNRPEDIRRQTERLRAEAPIGQAGALPIRQHRGRGVYGTDNGLRRD